MGKGIDDGDRLENRRECRGRVERIAREEDRHREERDDPLQPFRALEADRDCRRKEEEAKRKYPDKEQYPEDSGDRLQRCKPVKKLRPDKEPEYHDDDRLDEGFGHAGEGDPEDDVTRGSGLAMISRMSPQFLSNSR